MDFDTVLFKNTGHENKLIFLNYACAYICIQLYTRQFKFHVCGVGMQRHTQTQTGRHTHNSNMIYKTSTTESSDLAFHRTSSVTSQLASYTHVPLPCVYTYTVCTIAILSYSMQLQHANSTATQHEKITFYMINIT